MNCLTTLALVINKLRLLILFWLFLLTRLCLTAQDFPPKPDALVYDETDLLTAAQAQRLNHKLMGYMDTTSTQIAVAILSSTQGYAIDDYSFRMGEHWGIGQDGKDNGLLILIVPSQREMAIATGYGAEPKVTDALAKRQIVKTLRPDFQQELYYEGLDKVTNVFMGVLSGEFDADQFEEGPSVWSLLLLFMVFMVAMYFISRVSKGGGGRYYDPKRHTYMGPYRGSSTWQDFSGGSGSFGGGSSGGFGGFGGGSFGGGGASGSW